MITILTAAVYANSTSPGSTSVPAKKGDKNIIVNVNLDSHNTEKAIKSLEATLEKYFQQLVHVVNASSGVGSGIKLCLLFDFILLYFLPLGTEIHCILSCTGSSFASCKDIYLNGK